MTTRLAEVPTDWKARYHTLLENARMPPTADVARITSVEALRARARLLPPRPVYVHMTNCNHPSLPEPRVVAVERRAMATRKSNRLRCGNTTAFSMRALSFPSRPNVAQIKPSNLLMLTLPDGATECIHLDTVLAMYKRGYVFARSYQRDAKSDEWTEMRVDTQRRGTVRLPLWLLRRATGLAFPTTADRLQPPNETRYV